MAPTSDEPGAGAQLAKVEVYTRRGCMYCSRLIALFDELGVSYAHHDLTGDQARRAWLAEASGRDTVPQVFIDDVPVGGFTDVAAMHRRGELARRLTRAG
jgi:glutaredoxin 3